MIKLILTAFYILSAFTIAKAHNCGRHACKEGENCCLSINLGAECCPAISRCDFQYGCLERENKFHSSEKSKDCPPLWTKCFHSFFFDLCCPYIEAECCSDKAHCCPHGYECDLNNQRCNQKRVARIINEKDISSKDELMQCSDNVWCLRTDECCVDGNGEYSCCRNFTQSLKIDKNANEIITPQPEVNECPPLWTRCVHTSFFDLCCPYIEAECCSDKAHCCPHGYECDLDNQRCNPKNSSSVGNEANILSKDDQMQLRDKVWCSQTDECSRNENGKLTSCQTSSEENYEKDNNM